VLAGHDTGDVVDNDKNHDERHHAEAEAVDDNVPQTNNATTDAPLPRDEDDSDKNHQQQQDPEEQPGDDIVQQTTNAASEDPLPTDQRTERTESPIQSS
jgi:hypothetical protein